MPKIPPIFVKGKIKLLWSGEVAVHEVSSCRIADRHHGEGGDEEEGYDTQRTVVEKFHPKVAYLHIGTLLGIHYHTLLTL